MRTRKKRNKKMPTIPSNAFETLVYEETDTYHLPSDKEEKKDKAGGGSTPSQYGLPKGCKDLQAFVCNGF